MFTLCYRSDSSTCAIQLYCSIFRALPFLAVTNVIQLEMHACGHHHFDVCLSIYSHVWNQRCVLVTMLQLHGDLVASCILHKLPHDAARSESGPLLGSLRHKVLASFENPVDEIRSKSVNNLLPSLTHVGQRRQNFIMIGTMVFHVSDTRFNQDFEQ